MNDFWTDILNVAKDTAHRVGVQLMEDFGQVEASSKADGSLVTQADKWADEEIRNAIATRFPNHGILSEEAEHTFPDTEWCWIIDPWMARRTSHGGFRFGGYHWGCCIEELLYLVTFISHLLGNPFMAFGIAEPK
jgi:hypothetical protein